MNKIKAVMISVCISLVISFILLTISALVVTKTALLRGGALQVVTTLLCCLSVLAGGYFSALLIREKGIIFGFVTAVVFILVISGISFALQSPPGLGVAMIGKMCAVLLSGAIGGILGANRRGKVKF